MPSALRTLLSGVAVAALLAAGPAAMAQETAIPPLMQKINGGNWLDEAEAEELRNELFYQRAVYAYMTMLPAMNVIGMRDGSEAAFGDPK